MANHDDLSPLPFQSIDALKGKRLGEFRIIREIGRGSMGVVFEALQENLNRRVALKILPPSINLPEKAIRRFLREAESVAKLTHDHIVQIYAISRKESLYFYAMQFVDGSPLDEIIRDARSALTFERIADLIAQTAEAIDYAHHHGIIHRDIKPGNIIVTPEYKVVITDFGLARQERGATLTESGALVGTPIYMSPEQVHGKRGTIGKRSDIYSLGVTLYELLTGQVPFRGQTTQEILNEILEDDPKPPRRIDQNVPWELEVIAMKAMEKAPQHRFASAREMAADLRRYLDGEPIRARPTTVLTKVFKKIRKHRVASTALAIAGLILVIVTTLLVLSAHGAKKSREAFDQAINVGHQLLEEGKPDEAHDCFLDALERSPERPEAHVGLGLALFDLESHDRAYTAFSQAIACDETSVPGWLERCKLLIKLERWQEALQDLIRVRSLAPNNFEILQTCSKLLFNLYFSGKGASLEEKNDLLDKAIEYCEAALQLGNNADMRCRLGMLYLEKAKFVPSRKQQETYLDRSMAQIDQATKLDRNHRLAFELMARIEETRKTANWKINIFDFLKEQGYDENWVITQGYELVRPIWDFLSDEFLPSFDATLPTKSPADGKGPEY